jgi:hypothetical protein
MVRSMMVSCAVVFSYAGAAAAQTPPGGLFVDGRVVASLDQRGHVTLPPPNTVVSSDLSATVPGGGFGIGTLLSPRVSARVDVTWFGSTTGTQTTSTAITAIRDDIEISSQSFSVLAGFHPSTSGRLQPGYLAGVVFNRGIQSLHTTITTAGLPPFVSSAVTTSEGEGVSYDAAVVVGFELGVRVGSHLCVVPEVRASGSGGLLSIRPGVAVRWEP